MARGNAVDAATFAVEPPPPNTVLAGALELAAGVVIVLVEDDVLAIVVALVVVVEGLVISVGIGPGSEIVPGDAVIDNGPGSTPISTHPPRVPKGKRKSWVKIIETARSRRTF